MKGRQAADSGTPPQEGSGWLKDAGMVFVSVAAPDGVQFF